MTGPPEPPAGGWNRLENARSVIFVALVADGLQIAMALTTALFDPTKWREFFTFSSIAAGLVVTLVVVAMWRLIGAGRRVLGIAFVLANVAFVVFYARPEAVRSLLPEPSAQPAVTSTAPVPGTTASESAGASAPAPTPTPVPTPATTTAAPPPTRDAPKTSDAPAPPAAEAWTVTAGTSRESTVEPGSGVQLRFWPYPSGNEVVGDLRYENGYAWAPVGFGSGCTAPYATYVFSGIPAGAYVVSVHVPDVDGLTTNAEYSGPGVQLTLDQSAHRGEWVDLPPVRTSDVDGDAMIGITMNQRHDQHSGDTGCALRGVRIAFDAIRVTRAAS